MKLDSKPICTEPWTTIFVTWDGNVRTCCKGGRQFGSLDESSFEEIWNGSSYKEVRRLFASGEVPDECGICVKNRRMRRNSSEIGTVLRIWNYLQTIFSLRK